jgi:threonine/homoserine/homoserine lactone efflux protein
MSFLQGYLAGLAMIVFVGPVFFYLLKTSLEFGKSNGMLVVFGIIVSDIVAALLCYLGFGAYLNASDSQIWLSLTGGLILLFMGIRYLVVKTINQDSKKRINGAGRFMFFANGFLVNFVNPFVFGVWIGVAAYASEVFTAELSQIIFLVGALAGILTTDTAKVLLADYLKRFLHPQRMLIIYRIAGIVLILFSLRLLYFWLSMVIVL